MMMSLVEANQAMQGHLIGQSQGEDICFSGITIDSRRVQQGDLFFAIKGDQQDGHRYVESASAAGAAATVVDNVDAASDPSIVVIDTTLALGALAKHWRQRFDIPVFGITGSNGKTTVSAMLRAITDLALPGIAPEGSFNNHWGVPLTLLKLRPGHQSAVIEMGMNHPGELRSLTAITQPTIALINNATAAHLEGLKDVQGVAAAKAEIIEGVPESGTVVLNADDAYCADWQEKAGMRRVITFGLDKQATVSASEIQRGLQTHFILQIDGQSAEVCLNFLGDHNILNALAAAACAHAADISSEAIAEGLATAQPVSGRLKTLAGINGAALIDDSYNANPASMYAALRVLAAQPGERIAVLGAMAELGKQSRSAHAEVGELARELELDDLIAVGEAAKDYLEKAAFGQFQTDTDTAITYLRKRLNSNSVVLVKGSRSAGMERVIDGLGARKGAASC